MAKKGITIAGNILVDIVNMIDRYPQKNMLVQIHSSSRAVGGCVPNTIIDIAKMDKSVPLKAAGLTGNDDNGEFVISELQKYGINTDLIEKRSGLVTSRDYVMTEITTGERTFFYEPGASSEYDADGLADKLDCDMFHAGYILLLDKLDEEDNKYGTKMARLLHSVQERGIKTSVDVVSEDGGRFAEKVIPALKYCDYTFMNEIECCGVSGLNPRNGDGSINIDNIKRTMTKFFEYGVKEKVIVHSVEGGFMMNRDGSFVSVGSLKLPDNWIVGSVGAGDAYTAACLYSIYSGYDDVKTLEFAAAAAACNLSASDAIEGMRTKEEIEKLNKQFDRRVL